MSQEEKQTIEVTIYGKLIRVKTEESEEYVREIADIVSDVMKEIGRGRRTLSETAIYAALNFAEDFHLEKQKNVSLEKEIKKLKENSKEFENERTNFRTEIEQIQSKYNELIENKHQEETLGTLSDKLDAILEDDFESEITSEDKDSNSSKIDTNFSKPENLD